MFDCFLRDSKPQLVFLSPLFLAHVTSAAAILINICHLSISSRIFFSSILVPTICLNLRTMLFLLPLIPTHGQVQPKPTFWAFFEAFLFLSLFLLRLAVTIPMRHLQADLSK
ncbi:MAG: hypothetical protein FRX49_11647 [Trebouxia sp. A1-2]|nr:MAG: hypothetical protein FRX49_11647 [Trebouxia sp. A1-2]